ncbi:MAG: 2-keto-3-deoxy-galactonokinase [Rhodobacterales bacterium]|nr:MAG: 2-keto-3-deoxy-galactonokinase [Rhodobacterales bacterium]
MTDHDDIAWIGVAWGHTTLRAWAFRADGSVREARSGKADAKGAFGPALDLLLKGLPSAAPVICCGWKDADTPRAATPCPPPGGRDARRFEWSRPVYLLPGIAQAAPPELMGTGVVRIRGYLAQEPEFDGILCLPGARTIWAHISAGEIVSFRSFLTGELLALLAEHSSLGALMANGDWDSAAFDTALDDATARPEALAAQLSGLDARALLDGQSPAQTRSRLFGLLIGAELAAARPYWLGQNVAILGDDGALSTAYSAALSRQGVPTTPADAEQALLSGLRATYAEAVTG